jgi:DNA-binding GntR family transcriptional regulator
VFATVIIDKPVEFPRKISYYILMKTSFPASTISRHQIRESVQQMILSGERQPGTKLRQQELAGKFGVAQGVVREALLELAAYGLVEIIDNRGVYVSKIDKNRLLESFDVRAVHEGLAARLCCDRATRAEIRILREMVEQMYKLGQTKASKEMSLLDREFHSKLTELSGNSMLVRLAHNYRVLGKFVRANRDPELIRNEHLGILDAIEGGRADDAERLMRQHIGHARAAIDESMKSDSFEPQWVV